MIRRGRLAVSSLALCLWLTVGATPLRAQTDAPAHDMTAHEDAGATAPAAPVTILPGLGDHHRAVTTAVPQAQAFFDQGLRLLFAFNLDEAQRAFGEAARLDPACAMCWWGLGMSLGPHINLLATPERTVAAHQATAKAVAAVSRGTDVEKALVAALAKRYAEPAPTEPAAVHALEEAYATAMGEAAKRFPDDVDIATLYAESLMDLRPWDLWTADGRPQPGTEEIVATLERVLSKDPSHPGANHYYIHAVEASPHPEKALAAAERLGGLMPGAGHMVHMPAHTFIRTGRYADAAEANRRAIAADQSYLATAPPQGSYLMYVAHNPQFLWAAAQLQGRSAEALAAARQVEAILPLEMLRQMPGYDFTLLYPTWTLVRFAKWDEVLAEPSPPDDFPTGVALWHAARGLARVGKKDRAAAAAELASVRALAAKVPADAPQGFNTAHAFLAIADGLLAGEIAALGGDVEEAVRQLSAAVAAEDAMRYDEPAEWYFPVRHALGAVLLAAGRAPAAQAVYEADLARLPDNGWSLFGLAKSLAAQGKPDEAAAADARFRSAWKDADVTLVSSWH
jgi:tetratricopeptide (TPR) repeat protein